MTSSLTSLNQVLPSYIQEKLGENFMIKDISPYDLEERTADSDLVSAALFLSNENFRSMTKTQKKSLVLETMKKFNDTIPVLNQLEKIVKNNIVVIDKEDILDKVEFMNKPFSTSVLVYKVGNKYTPIVEKISETKFTYVFDNNEKFQNKLTSIEVPDNEEFVEEQEGGAEEDEDEFVEENNIENVSSVEVPETQERKVKDKKVIEKVIFEDDIIFHEDEELDLIEINRVVQENIIQYTDEQVKTFLFDLLATGKFTKEMLKRKEKRFFDVFNKLSENPEFKIEEFDLSKKLLQENDFSKFKLLPIAKYKKLQVVKDDVDEETDILFFENFFEFFERWNTMENSANNINLKSGSLWDFFRTYKLDSSQENVFNTKFDLEVVNDCLFEDDTCKHHDKLIGRIEDYDKAEVYKGDPIELVGFLNKSNEDSQIQTFNLLEYYDMIDSLEIGDNITIYFNDADIIEEGKIDSIEDTIIKVKLNKSVSYLGKKNDEFFYNKNDNNRFYMYNAEFPFHYYKKLLKTKNIGFKIDSSDIKKGFDFIYPNFNELFHMYQDEISEFKNLEDFRKLLDYYLYNLEYIKTADFGKIREILDNIKKINKDPLKPVQYNQQTTTLKNIPKMLDIKKENEFNYNEFNKFIDSEFNRFRTMNDKKHAFFNHLTNIWKAELEKIKSEFSIDSIKKDLTKTQKQINEIKEVDDKGCIKTIEPRVLYQNIEQLENDNDVYNVFSNSPDEKYTDEEKEVAVFIRDELENLQDEKSLKRHVSEFLKKKYPEMEKTERHSNSRDIFNKLKNRRVKPGDYALIRNTEDYFKRAGFDDVTGTNNLWISQVNFSNNPEKCHNDDELYQTYKNFKENSCVYDDFEKICKKKVHIINKTRKINLKKKNSLLENLLDLLENFDEKIKELDGIASMNNSFYQALGKLSKPVITSEVEDVEKDMKGDIYEDLEKLQNNFEGKENPNYATLFQEQTEEEKERIKELENNPQYTLIIQLYKLLGLKINENVIIRISKDIDQLKNLIVDKRIVQGLKSQNIDISKKKLNEIEREKLLLKVMGRDVAKKDAFVNDVKIVSVSALVVLYILATTDFSVLDNVYNKCAKLLSLEKENKNKEILPSKEALLEYVQCVIKDFYKSSNQKILDQVKTAFNLILKEKPGLKDIIDENEKLKKKVKRVIESNLTELKKWTTFRPISTDIEFTTKKSSMVDYIKIIKETIEGNEVLLFNALKQPLTTNNCCIEKLDKNYNYYNQIIKENSKLSDLKQNVKEQIRNKKIVKLSIDNTPSAIKENLFLQKVIDLEKVKTFKEVEQETINNIQKYIGSSKLEDDKIFSKLNKSENNKETWLEISKTSNKLFKELLSFINKNNNTNLLNENTVEDLENFLIDFDEISEGNIVEVKNSLFSYMRNELKNTFSRIKYNYTPDTTVLQRKKDINILKKDEITNLIEPIMKELNSKKELFALMEEVNGSENFTELGLLDKIMNVINKYITNIQLLNFENSKYSIKLLLYVFTKAVFEMFTFISENEELDLDNFSFSEIVIPIVNTGASNILSSIVFYTLRRLNDKIKTNLVDEESLKKDVEILREKEKQKKLAIVDNPNLTEEDRQAMRIREQIEVAAKKVIVFDMFEENPGNFEFVEEEKQNMDINENRNMNEELMARVDDRIALSEEDDIPDEGLFL